MEVRIKGVLKIVVVLALVVAGVVTLAGCGSGPADESAAIQEARLTASELWLLPETLSDMLDCYDAEVEVSMASWDAMGPESVDWRVEILTATNPGSILRNCYEKAAASEFERMYRDAIVGEAPTSPWIARLEMLETRVGVLEQLK